MVAEWHFKPHTPGSTIREPIAGAFFAAEAVSEPGEALVREGIQNSLDAALHGSKILVRISLVTQNGALCRQAAGLYFDGARLHHEAEGNGLRVEDLPQADDSLTLLVFEDFGTSGLQGDPTAPYPAKGRGENNFFHFFRAEGLSDKEPGKRGSWGLGKDTFFRASKINTVFGLTIRNDDERHLLMGKTVLKSHWVGDDYCQDGYFGIVDDGQTLVLPSENRTDTERFKQIFRLERRDDPGLSIVVPWLDPEITEQALLQSVLKNYAYAILDGNLDVIVETAGIETLLEKDSIIAEAQNFSEHPDIVLTIELSEWAIRGVATENRITLAMTNPDRVWTWDKNLFTDDILKELGEKINGNEYASVRVPVTVRKRSHVPIASHFDVFLVNEGSNQRIRPVFIRDGIVVSDVRAPLPAPGVRSIVLVDDPPLSEFLRQAENPSHTVWQGQQVKRDYTSGVGDLSFVVSSVKRICDIIAAQDKEEDKNLLADIFPILSRGGEPPPQARYFAINQIDGGFSVTPGNEPIPVNTQAEIFVAYDVRRGMAMTQYRPTDFQLQQPPIHCLCEGAEIVAISDSRLVIQVVEPEKLHVAVTGFDANRQILVDIPDQAIVIPDA